MLTVTNAVPPPRLTFTRMKPGELDRLFPLRRCVDSTGKLLQPPARSKNNMGCSNEGGCPICYLDEHPSTVCPYFKSHVPKNAIVGRLSGVFCTVCGGVFSERCCNQDVGFAALKICAHCFKYGDHWSHECTCEPVNTSLGNCRPLTRPYF